MTTTELYLCRLLVADIMKYRENQQAKSAEEKQQHQEDCQKVSELSSDYFQLIPQKNFVYEQLRPLDTLESYRGQVRLLTNLLDFEVTTKMMLGAMYRKSGMYIFFMRVSSPVSWTLKSPPR